MATSHNKEAVDSGYNEFFGEDNTPPTVEFHKPNLQKMESLGHEPLFPDVDEAMIKPTVALGIHSTNDDNLCVSTSQKEEFTIVLDPSTSDPRTNQTGNVPVADWVMQSVPTRREPAPIRQSTHGMHNNLTSPRLAGLHPPSTNAPPPAHSRMSNPSGGSRTIRIPPGCNPDLEPEFPTRAAPDQALKLPGQTRVTPDEYKEFLGLGHGEIFNLDLDRVVDPPWRAPNADTTDFFNYGLDEVTWKDYCKQIESHRQEFSMKKKIQTYESSNVHYQQDPDLPPEVAAAMAAETYQSRTGNGPDLSKALPIPVFQGADDYSLRSRRGRDFRRPEVRYDPEVILELAGGIDPSNGVNADYGDEYISPFIPADMKSAETRPLNEKQHQDEIMQTEQKRDSTASKTEESAQETLTTKAMKDASIALFEDDDTFDDTRAKNEIVRPGELAMGMDTDPVTQGFPTQKFPPPPQGTVDLPRADFGRVYEPYGNPQDMWRPMYHPGGWRPRSGPYERGPSGYWPGRGGHGRSNPDAGRGGYGRPWHPYGGGPRRPLRRIPPPKYYEEYRMSQYPPPWPRRDDHPPSLYPYPEHHHPESDAKDPTKTEAITRDGSLGMEHSSSYRDHERRQQFLMEHEDDRGRSRPRSRTRDYDLDSRSFAHHRDRGRDYSRSHRRDEYDDRHRDRRRRGRSSERDTRRHSYSKERPRGKDRDDRRSRRHETSDSDSDSRYRNRSKDRD